MLFPGKNPEGKGMRNSYVKSIPNGKLCGKLLSFARREVIISVVDYRFMLDRGT